MQTPSLRARKALRWFGVLGREVAAFVAVAGEGAAAVGASVVGLVAAAGTPATATAAATAAVVFDARGCLVAGVARSWAVVAGGGGGYGHRWWWGTLFFAAKSGRRC